MEKEIGELIGKTLTQVTVNDDNDEIVFITDSERYTMWHEHECCEQVSIEDIAGDLTDLIGSPIIKASEDTNREDGKDEDESFTWTFYNIATIKGQVTIRWYGSSNGYYSESVSFATNKNSYE
jgi:hypothetical protein